MTRMLLLAALALALPSAAMADIGPKPTIAFNLKAGPDVRIAEGVLFECDNARCATRTPLQRLGPQGFGCKARACSGQAYGFSEYVELQLTFADGRRLTSPPIAKTDFDESFDVAIRDGRLKVTPAR
jgi:hypothetical protein